MVIVSGIRPSAKWVGKQQQIGHLSIQINHFPKNWEYIQMRHICIQWPEYLLSLCIMMSIEYVWAPYIELAHKKTHIFKKKWSGLQMALGRYMSLVLILFLVAVEGVGSRENKWVQIFEDDVVTLPRYTCGWLSGWGDGGAATHSNLRQQN